MNVLVIDPKSAVAAKVAPLLRQRNWTCSSTTDMPHSLDSIGKEMPDAVVIQGDGPRGEAAHLCQRFKQNVLTASVPLILVEETTPPAWLLAGLPADAILQSPWEPEELMHHVESLLPINTGSGTLDDLTNLPRRKSILDDVSRRMLARELFGVGVLNLREADAYRQDYGRNGIDQFVVLVSVLLRRHTVGSNPVSIGYLDEGSFLVVGSSATVHEIVAQTTRDFDALVPAYYEMDTLFGKVDDHDVGPATWIGLQGAVCLVEPSRFDNLLQIGYALSDTLASGIEALQSFSRISSTPTTHGLAAD